jgi:hypothetical protein
MRLEKMPFVGYSRNGTTLYFFSTHIRTAFATSKRIVTQRILSIDASISPPQALLLDVDGTSFNIVERYIFDCVPEDFFVNKLSSPKASSYKNSSNDLSSLPNAARQAELSHAALTTPEVDSSSLAVHETNPLTALKLSLAKSWEATVLVIAPTKLLTLNLTLPFSSPKDISQIIAGEIQDNLPLPLDDFHIQYDIRGSYGPNLTEVRVQLIEKTLLENLLALCKEAKIEPTLVTTPGSLLPIALSLATEHSQDKPHAILLSQQRSVVLTIYANGSYRSEHIFHHDRNPLSTAPLLKRSIRWAEKRYALDLKSLYFIGTNSEKEGFQRKVNRTLRHVILPARTSTEHLIGTVAAIAVQEDAVKAPLGNLLSGPYATNPLLRFGLQKFKEVVPALLTTLFVILLLLPTVYFFREYQINSYRSALAAKIKSIAPELNAAEGTETAELGGKTRKLEDQLRAMSIFSDLTPLDIMGLLSRFVPKETGVEMNYLSIVGKVVTMRGTAPDHATVEKVKREIKKNERTFCKVKKLLALNFLLKSVRVKRTII